MKKQIFFIRNFLLFIRFLLNDSKKDLIETKSSQQICVQNNNNNNSNSLYIYYWFSADNGLESHPVI